MSVTDSDPREPSLIPVPTCSTLGLCLPPPIPQGPGPWDSQEVMLGSPGQAAIQEPRKASFPGYGWVDFSVCSVNLNKLGLNAQPLGDHVGDSEERYHSLSGASGGNEAPCQDTLPTCGTDCHFWESTQESKVAWPPRAVDHKVALSKQGPSTRVSCHHGRERSQMIW